MFKLLFLGCLDVLTSTLAKSSTKTKKTTAERRRSFFTPNRGGEGLPGEPQWRLRWLLHGGTAEVQTLEAAVERKSRWCAEKVWLLRQ